MKREKPFPLLLVSVSLATLLLSACEFRSRHASWHLRSAVTYKLRYEAEIRAKADGSWGAGPYVSAAQAEFTATTSADTSKGQVELTLIVDTLAYRSSERGPEEDEYMTGRLRKYKAKLALAATGQMVSLEEEPSLPSVAFSPLNFGRLMAFALPAFPASAIKQGSRWEISQPLLDKFHPESRIRKRFTLSAIRETPQGDIATCLVEMDAFLDEDLGNGENAGKPSLSGRGQMVFNLTQGRPVSSEFEMDGRFIAQAASPKTTDAPQPEALPLRLQEKISLRFSD
jgi:hypothetical protein